MSNGQRVKRGDIIGYSGNTGNSTGPHLHFEVYTYPCRNTPPFSRFPPRDQIAHEAKQAPTIIPAGPNPNEQDAPMSAAEVNAIQKMHDVTRQFIIDQTQKQQDVTRSHLINTTQKQHDVTRAHVINKVSGATQAQEDVTRKYLSDRIAEGAKPADVADSVIAALGTDLAGQVVQELATRLTDLGVTK